MQQKERRVCVETEDGMTVWIPESKLEAWEKADHNAPLSEEQKEMVSKIMKKLLGGRGRGNG